MLLQVLKDTFSGGAQEIEDLWLPFFCVSTNLSRAQVQARLAAPVVAGLAVLLPDGTAQFAAGKCSTTSTCDVLSCSALAGFFRMRGAQHNFSAEHFSICLKCDMWPQVHQIGPLWQLVRASMTIVGMVPPVIRGGDMLVDGGYLNNLPVDVMHSLGVHTVLVVCGCSHLLHGDSTAVCGAAAAACAVSR